jgi:cystathionine beta-lyase
MTLYNFDEPINRKNTACAKWDRHAKSGKPEDLLPLWVADMDFPVPHEVTRALHERVDHAIFGYTDPSDSYYEAVTSWFEAHHGWSFDAEEITITPGVCFALAQAVQAFTQPGDAVLIQPPVYYPFRMLIAENNRVVVKAPLTYDVEVARTGQAWAVAHSGESGEGTAARAEHGAESEEGVAAADAASAAARGGEVRPPHPYSIDFDAFEQTIIETRPKLFFLCNPHNPVGRVWREDELRRMGEICFKHDVIVVSDEIHADFSRPGFRHVPFATLGEEFKQKSVICTAPSKTFNLAGLQVSNIVIADPKLRLKFRAAVDATGYGNINSLGMVAAEASYRYGLEWLTQVKEYLEGNLAAMNEFLARELPQVTLVQPESTYLTWVDCHGLDLTHDELKRAVEEKARLWLDHGAMFGSEGVGFMRFNNATQRATLMQALEQFSLL